MKVNTKFHVFSVYDYKGGELGCTLNLDYNEFIDYLTGHFEGYFEDFGEYTETEISEEDYEEFETNYKVTNYLWEKYVTTQSLLDYFYNNFSDYAGNGSTVEDWYISSSPELKEYTLTDADEKLLLEKVRENYIE